MRQRRINKMIELGFIFTKGEIKMATAIASTEKNLDPRSQFRMPSVSYKGVPLSDTQVSILSLIGEAMNNTEIAELLSVSKRTVESHIANIRNLITRVDGYRPRERNLVLFAKEMLDGYDAFLRIKRNRQITNAKKLGHTIELIEDWDDYEFLESDQEPSAKNKILELDQFRVDYEITDFSTEEKEIRFSDGKYYLV